MNIKNLRLKIKNCEGGQIVLILVLISVVGLTIGLSLISRTITDIRISSQIEQSSRAFSAAEAGIESALRQTEIEKQGTINLTGNVSADFEISKLGGSTNAYNFPFTNVNNTQTLWLIDHDSNGQIDLINGNFYSPSQNIDVCWGTADDDKPALLLTVLYLEDTTYKIAKVAYDVVARTPTNNFPIITTSPGNNCDGNYFYKIQVTLQADFGIASGAKPIALRIQPLYSGASISVKSNANLPVQGKQIISSGRTETGVSRKIQVTQGYNVLPTLFDFTLFSWEADCP